ncbi:MAG: hypothetical protein QG657_268, partial [Acidobacteriota bacterium]|nr:hypothetical protein [Acidobacteriota bacterium]
RLVFLRGEYDRAEEYLRRALAINPQNAEILLVLSELYSRKFKFEEAGKYLDKAAAAVHTAHPASFYNAVRLSQAELAEKKMDFKTSEALYRELLEKDPVSIAALFGMAKISNYLNRFDEAEKYIQQCYQTDPGFGPAYLLHSRIHRMRQNTGAWKDTVRKAVEFAPFDAEARVAYATVLMRGEGKLNEGVQQAKIAVKIDPFCLPAHSFLGNGSTAVLYEDYQPKGDEATVRNITGLYQNGDRCLVEGDYAKADEAFTALLKLDPQHTRAIIGKGAVYFHRKEYDAALDCYFQALKLNPDYGLAHYGVALALQQLLDRVNILFPGLEKRFAETVVPEPPYLRDIFINYSQCSPDLQKIIRSMVTPLGNYMKALKLAGATVYFMDIHQFLWECPNMKEIKGQRTFDLRLWDDVKGAGGYHCIGNKAQQTDVKYLRFNVAGHEFAHLVQQLLPPGQEKELRRLYLKAKAERNTLDWYADMNAEEYFAVGYEAFISQEKLPAQVDVYAHTRDQLMKKDPDLYHFIEQLNTAADYRENEIMGFIMKAGYTSPDPGKRMIILKEALSTYGNHPDLLNAIAGEYMNQKQYDEALKTYQQAIAAFPEDIDAYLEIAKDIFLRKGNTQEAAAFLKNNETRLANHAAYYFHLGTLYFYEGLLDEMADAFNRGLKLNPWPDIYSPEYFLGDPYFMLAMGSAVKEDYEGAEKNIMISLEKFNRNFAIGWAELADILLKTGREKEGKTHLDTALRLQPQSPNVQEVQAAYLLKEGKKQEVRDILTKILEGQPRRIQARLLMAEVLMDMEPGLQGAHEILAKGVELLTSGNVSEQRHPLEISSVSRLYSSLASVLEKQGQVDEAVKYHLAAVEKFKYNYASLAALVRLYKKTGQEEKADEASNKLKMRNPPKKYLL